MKQAVDCDLSLYTDDSCLPVQRRQRRKIKQSLDTHFLKI